jgi:hypothetical protein
MDTSAKLASLSPEISNIYTSLQQASKWGMRLLQGTFPRYKKRLPGNASKRKKVIQLIVLIRIIWTEHVGLNQIKTVFDPEYECYMNLTGYDRIKN